ncbi:MAG: ATP-binding protein [Eubacteriales bacterium]|nr:ATP-binding protein [Eubacteriales bacterium]
MNSRTIGKITSVGVHGIIADVYDGLGNYVNTLDGVRFVGEVGSYVSIYEVGRTIIAEVIGVDEKTVLSAKDNLQKPNSRRQIYLNCLGEIQEHHFFFGVSRMPLIFSEIHLISEDDLITMLEVETEELLINQSENTRAVMLPIGRSVFFPEYDVKVNIDKFFGFHFAVFGNTGAGKSNTIARILQEIFKKKGFSAKGAKFVIIDSNGEYSSAFSKIKERNNELDYSLKVADMGVEQKLEIPVWALSADDWAVLLHASEKTQIPVLKRAIDIAKVFYGNAQDNLEVKNHILASTLLGIINSSDSSPSKVDKLKAILTRFGTENLSLNCSMSSGSKLADKMQISYGQMKEEESVIEFLTKFVKDELIGNLTTGQVVPYDLSQFIAAVEFATLYEGSISSQRIQEYTATLTTRLQTIRDGIQGKLLTKTNFCTVDEYIGDLLGKNQIVDVDISMLDDASAEVVTKVLAKLLLDYLKRRDKKADMPINFIIEEAHRFVRNESNFGAVGYNIFERIAKEGRKFGMLLGISSQRPSELSKTVVSQCSNFIIHRVQNPDDLQYISRMVPYLTQNSIDRLTYLQTGHALVFGSAINMPTLTKFEQANPKTDSENAKISEKWYIE